MHEKYSLALVTGATSGIGEAFSRLLAAKGIPLLITGRDAERLRALSEELGRSVKVVAFKAELADAQQRQQVIDMIGKYSPDLMVNNAGFGIYGEAISHNTQKQLEIVEVNATAVLELTLEAAKQLVKVGKAGTILNVSSAAAFQPFPLLATYAASKAFVNSLSESLDWELRPHGVRVLTACPGMVSTQFGRRASGGHSNAYSGMEKHSVMGVNDAAEELWQQIVKEKAVHVFNWKTRLGTFLSRYVLPKGLVSKILAGNIKKRLK